MESLLVRLSIGMTVIIAADGDHGVTVETLTQWPTFLDRAEESRIERLRSGRCWNKPKPREEARPVQLGHEYTTLTGT